MLGIFVSLHLCIFASFNAYLNFLGHNYKEEVVPETCDVVSLSPAHTRAQKLHVTAKKVVSADAIGCMQTQKWVSSFTFRVLGIAE